jgi:type I restriction enzyme S subunit
LGPIPEGWGISRLDEVGKEIVLGKTPSTKDPENFGQHMPFIKIPSMRSSLFNIQTDTYLSRKGAESQENKTLPPNTICVSCIGTVGLVTITTEPSQTNQQINSIILKDQIWREYLFFALSDLKKIIQLHGATGATMPNLSKTKFSALQIVVPEETKISNFHNFTYPMFEQIKNLQFMNENLRQTRDLLLPKLVSGEVDVSELEIAV